MTELFFMTCLRILHISHIYCTVSHQRQIGCSREKTWRHTYSIFHHSSFLVIPDVGIRVEARWRRITIENNWFSFTDDNGYWKAFNYIEITACMVGHFCKREESCEIGELVTRHQQLPLCHRTPHIRILNPPALPLLSCQHTSIMHRIVYYPLGRSEREFFHLRKRMWWVCSKCTVEWTIYCKRGERCFRKVGEWKLPTGILGFLLQPASYLRTFTDSATCSTSRTTNHHLPSCLPVN